MMKKRIVALILLLAALLCLCSCAKDKESSFCIQFIDVGQGDAALVECDGHYMLIDGGEKSAGAKVSETLAEEGVRKLDILVASHLHSDHIGGLIGALDHGPRIGRVISNADDGDTETFREFKQALRKSRSRIRIPSVGDRFELGSATVEVVDVSAREDNDSLVLLITYGKTRFLFTGDIERRAQLRVAEALGLDREKQGDWVSLIKMPHHGAYHDDAGYAENALYRLFWEYDPDYFVISVGEDNRYGHPHSETMALIEDMVVKAKGQAWEDHVFRTDERGDVTVRSNGKEIFVETSKR